jgi:hypothetical protein
MINSIKSLIGDFTIPKYTFFDLLAYLALFMFVGDMDFFDFVLTLVAFTVGWTIIDMYVIEKLREWANKD